MTTTFGTGSNDGIFSFESELNLTQDGDNVILTAPRAAHFFARTANSTSTGAGNTKTVDDLFAFYDEGQDGVAGYTTIWGLGINTTNNYINGSLRLGSAVAPTGGIVLDVTGNAAISGSVTGNTFTMLTGGSQSYTFKDRGDALVIESQNSGDTHVTTLFTKDGDGTDNIGLAIYGKGTAADITDSQLLNIQYLSRSTRFQIQSAQNGVEALLELYLQTEGNIGQIVLETDGDVSIEAGDLKIISGRKLKMIASNSDQGDIYHDSNDLVINPAVVGTGGVKIVGDTFWEGDGTGLFYGNMDQDGGTFDVTLTDANTLYELDAATTNISPGPLNDISFPGDHFLKINTAGVYMIVWSLVTQINSVAGGDQHLEFEILINGSATNKGESHITLKNVVRELPCGSVTLLDLAVNDEISIGVTNTSSAGKIVTIDHLEMTVDMKGGT